MTSFPRARLPVGLGIALLVACSHSSTTGQGGTVTPAPAAAPGSVVTEEELSRTPGRTIEQLLMDRFPGVLVARTPDGGISVRIRGVSSLVGSNEPLYVVDDVPIQAGAGGTLRGINPHDISSIQVLKDPAQTAVYGVRGANGVIVIRTKRPGQ